MLTAATLFDVVTSGAVISLAPHGGVSVNMSIHYLSPVHVDKDCEIDARVTKLEGGLAFSEVVLRHKHTGKVAAKGTDIKFIPTTPDPTASGKQGTVLIGALKQCASPEAAELFIKDLVSASFENFHPEDTGNFETTALYGLKDITATEGQVVCTLPVRPRVENVYRTLHGGCIGAQKSCTDGCIPMHGGQTVYPNMLRCCFSCKLPGLLD